MDGSYKIKVKEGATLVFSYVGFNSWKSSYRGSMNVVLSEEGGQN
jgi:iron complex outermembrane receptor protein